MDTMNLLRMIWAVLILGVSVHLCLASRWMYLGLTAAQASTSTVCEIATYESSYIRELFCRTDPSFIRTIGFGIQMAIEECKRRFKKERWNCPTSVNKFSVFGPIVNKGTKETAFIYAVTSAGVTYAITRACALGRISDCACDNTKKGSIHVSGKWKWADCNDDVRFGMNFARNFIDTIENDIHQGFRRDKKKNNRRLMNLHNNRAGRLAVQLLMRVECRCNGVSGSCATKVCRKTLASFSDVGEYLKQRYAFAVEVLPKAKRRLRRRGDPRHLIDHRDLVYMDLSPSFCEQDARHGTTGTSGRICNRTSNDVNNCQILCCGNGYNIQLRRTTERCGCKFLWCCNVTCSTCERLEEVYTCK